MKKIENFKSISPEESEHCLPAGGYVVKIRKVREEIGASCRKLIVEYDVAEGPYENYFLHQYEMNPYGDKKWKGATSVFVTNNRSQIDNAHAKRHLESFIGAVESSNPGYHWNWDEETLVDKFVGVIYRKRQWSIKGRTGWTTECGVFTSIWRIRSGNYRPLADKPLKHTIPTVNEGNASVNSPDTEYRGEWADDANGYDDSEGELPF